MTITNEDVIDNIKRYSLDIPTVQHDKDKFIITLIHNQSVNSLLQFRFESDYQDHLENRINGTSHFYSHTSALELLLYPFHTEDISTIKNIVNGLFINEKNDKPRRMIIAYYLFSLACQTESLTKLTNSDYWSSVDSGNIFDKYFRWIYLFTLAKYSHDELINPTSFRINMIEYFDIQNNPEHEKTLIEVNTLYRQVIPTFINEILNLKDDKDFQVVINYFRTMIEQHNIKSGYEETDYNYFMENIGVDTWSFEQLFIS